MSAVWPVPLANVIEPLSTWAVPVGGCWSIVQETCWIVSKLNASR